MYINVQFYGGVYVGDVHVIPNIAPKELWKHEGQKIWGVYDGSAKEWSGVYKTKAPRNFFYGKYKLQTVNDIGYGYWYVETPNKNKGVTWGWAIFK